LDKTALIHFTVSLFVITNAFGNLAIYIGLTKDCNREEKLATIKRMVIALVCIFFLITWTGNWVLTIFGIDLPSFQVAGGVILMLIGVSMLQSDKSPNASHHYEEDVEHKSLVGIVPLGMPIIGGPGAITVLFEAVHEYNAFPYKLAFSGIELVVIAFIAIVFYFSNFIEYILGRAGIKVITRIMGLLLAAIASKMLLSGMHTSLIVGN
jgi:multiple antibiotic resistance protein